MIKVLVVDDSIFMRNIISDMLAEEHDIEIVGKARNGKEAIRLNRELSPDVITLDVEMPVMNGLEALKEIMKDKPTKVIMVSSLTSEGAIETIEALENGAFDFVQKPSGTISLDIRTVKKDLLEKIRVSLKANIKILETSAKDEKVKLSKFMFNKPKKTVEKFHRNSNKIVAIGISTGGPKALQNIIPELPQNINAGILIVQHMPPKFTKSLADRLDLLSNIRVKEAEDGDEVVNGQAYIAPGNYHMVVKDERGKKIIRLNQEANYSGHRPSANVLFKSVAEIYKKEAVGVIMTGMGGDGAEYLKVMKENGAKTIGQSKDTCVVYGMPRVANELGAVDYVEDLMNIPQRIVKLVGGDR
ncbi:protein-glutamate methylesterase/protein-glutamine glutaminase [Haliovirga abyssi]|uniref:Protein-glutamate methylesterase/protein-glutamine glutaminase n=1 Tax=Haliovirga abyssi TaxID=2996794 RepID=A0AAU9D2A2_9FUSO|nr:chemotaxis response regulator protein-glutamate methylesterase [Haliovirga abyssi]BDU50126.1 chemotaxis response regulator protein-glutamate methylesterase [Haliovirga abyssi]